MKKLQKIVMVVATLTLVATTQASPTDELIDGELPEVSFQRSAAS